MTEHIASASSLVLTNRERDLLYRFINETTKKENVDVPECIEPIIQKLSKPAKEIVVDSGREDMDIHRVCGFVSIKELNNGVQSSFNVSLLLKAVKMVAGMKDLDFQTCWVTMSQGGLIIFGGKKCGFAIACRKEREE